MKRVVLGLMLLCVSQAFGWKIDSAYQIVLPDKAYDGTVLRALDEGARALRKTLLDRGVDAAVVRESKRDKTKKAIFLGFPDGKKYEFFNGSIRIADGNIYITGNDRHGRGAGGNHNSFYAYYLGSIKALTVFMEKYLNTRFVLPGIKGVAALPGALPELPEKLFLPVAPKLIFGTGRYSSLLYDYANNNFGRGSVHSYGGHSYYSAIPQAKYAKSHPEYFSVLDGQRSVNIKYYSHCISNPAVQELIYKEMLDKLDAGAETVELAQTDGYRACECDKCKALYGVSDPAEKLWILHRNLAERLLKERPGKKVLIIAYSPTFDPPATFKEFPANVMVELCRYEAPDFDAWNKVKVPQGYITYIYNWGYYQINGLTPKFSLKMAADQVRRFVKNNVRGVYRCGFGELFGLEGEVYYAYGKLFDDPSADPETIAAEFCRAAYGEAAAGAMGHFYRSINDRIDLIPTAFHGVRTGVAQTPEQLLTALWTPPVIASLENSLRSAERQPMTSEQKERFNVVKHQFGYLKNLISILNFYNAYKLKPSFELLNPLLDLIGERNRMIADSYDGKKGKSIPGWPEIPRFGIPKEAFPVNGRMYGIISAPLTWNVKTIREKKVLPGNASKSMRVLRAAGEAVGTDFEAGMWKNIPWETLAGIQLNPVRAKSRFKVAFDRNNLYVGLESDLPEKNTYIPGGRDAKCWQWDCVELVVDPWGTRDKYFHFIVNPVENSCYESAVGLIDDPLHPLFRGTDVSWNGKWDYRTVRKGDVWKVLFTIPFSSLGVGTPKAGDSWTFNLCREAFLEPEKRSSEPELSCWSPCFEALSFHERSTFGELRFE